MTATNVIIDNWIDYSVQLTDIATHLSVLPTLLTSIQNIEKALLRISTATEKISSATQVISTQTLRMANTSSMNFDYVQNKDVVNNYFEPFTHQRIPEVQSAGSWTGATNTIKLVTSTRNSSILPGQRVEGDNINLDTFVSSVNPISGTLIINRSTIGSSKGNTVLYFFAS
jgi:hypothetical protein